MTPAQRSVALRLADYLGADDWPGGLDGTKLDIAATLLRELAAAPQSEPVAYLDPRQLARNCAAIHCITRPEYRSAADAAAGLEYVPVYLRPALKPLTAEQAHEAMLTVFGPPLQFDPVLMERIARAIERAHGIVSAPPL